jgi:hypothetical protein
MVSQMAVKLIFRQTLHLSLDCKQRQKYVQGIVGDTDMFGNRDTPKSLGIEESHG